jgi:hypothetical protein
MPRYVAGSDASAGAILLLAGRAEPEQLDAVTIDLVSSAPGHLCQDRRHAQVLEIDRTLAASTNQVVMMAARVASNVRVVAVREVEPLNDAEAGQDFERPEDGRPRRLDLAPPGIGHEVGRLEGPVASAYQAYDGTPGIGHPVTGSVQRSDDLVGGRAGMYRRRVAHSRQHIPARE